MSTTFHAQDLSKNTNAVTLMSYATEEELQKVILSKREYILGCAYIFHDKDDNENHYHIQLTLKRSRRLSDIIGWFKNCSDSKGEKANTFGEITLSCRAQEEYFTHSDDESRNAGKHQYLPENIKVLDDIGDPWDFVTAHDKQVGVIQKRRESEDENEQLLQDIIDGVSQREMARKYGRDYMKNFKVYRAFASNVVLEETCDIALALELQGDLIDKRTAQDIHHTYSRGAKDALFAIESLLEKNASYQQIKKIIKTFKDEM